MTNNTDRMTEILEIATAKFIDFDSSYLELADDEILNRDDYFTDRDLAFRTIRPIDDATFSDSRSFHITLPYDCQIDIIALQIDDNPKTALADAFFFHISADTTAYIPMIPKTAE